MHCYVIDNVNISRSKDQLLCKAIVNGTAHVFNITRLAHSPFVLKHTHSVFINFPKFKV